MKHQNNNGRRRVGALAVEVAMCLPILMMVLFGCYEVARANMLVHATESAAYEGARIGIIPGATVEKVEASVTHFLQSVGIRDFKINVTPGKIERNTPQIEVEVIVPFDKNTVLPAFFLSDPKFTGKCSLSREIP